MQLTLCDSCHRELSEEEDDAYWYVKPVNMGPDYRPPRSGYRHVALCSGPCLVKWAQECGSDPLDSLGPALVGE